MWERASCSLCVVSELAGCIRVLLKPLIIWGWGGGVKLTSTPRSSECNKDVLVTTNLLVESRVRQVSYGGRLLNLLLGLDTSLLGDEVGQTLQIPTTAVVGGCLALAIEELERGESLDAKPAAEALLGVGVDLGDLDLVLGGLEGGGELLVDGSQVLAVAAPWREELDERGLAGLQDELVEVIGDQVEDGGLGSHGGCQAGEHEALEKDHYC